MSARETAPAVGMQRCGCRGGRCGRPQPGWSAARGAQSGTHAARRRRPQDRAHGQFPENKENNSEFQKCARLRRSPAPTAPAGRTLMHATKASRMRRDPWSSLPPCLHSSWQRDRRRRLHFFKKQVIEVYSGPSSGEVRNEERTSVQRQIRVSAPLAQCDRSGPVKTSPAAPSTSARDHRFAVRLRHGPIASRVCTQSSP